MTGNPASKNAVSTTNACKLCTPLGASLAFKGVEGAVPFLHGSQGCATYMRRYIISHFREPIDIASSALGEKHAVYGGGPNLKKGILNVMKKYSPSLVGVASTCLTETIGDDMGLILHEFRNDFGDLDLPDVVHVSTPSYQGTHSDGFNRAVHALVDQLADPEAAKSERVALFPGMVSPADIRLLKDIFREYGLTPTVLPDISETLDGPALEDYEPVASGGTPVSEIKALSGAAASVEFGSCLPKDSAGLCLEKRFGIENDRLRIPLGIRGADALHDVLCELSGLECMPRRYKLERGRLVDAYVDGHKYVFGKRAVVYGEENLVVALTAFLAEIGVQPVLVGTGAEGKGIAASIEAACEGVLPELPLVREGVDFHDIAEEAETMSPELVLGNSKGQRYARAWNAPLIRVGFPIHDRFGGQRLKTVSYEGTQELYDRIVNALIEKKQSDSPVGWGYI
ncbi:nitrogenase component 1 [Salidesulfovibrio brasiliensis]|uniref:nitrogenase component 1 n=1 Tax=Salidesulfovibrio brasiliensis TaxID=221711 RepID=UPI0006D18575|nr:nitrogenase component 1 [Salidesulfovibrio brasiliensis]